MNLNIVLIKETSHHEELFLEAGDHSYDFEVTIPKNAPSSFEHRYAILRYSLQATVDVPRSLNTHVQNFITIINSLDLNDKPNLQEPHGVSLVKVYGCGLCKTSPIIANFGVFKCELLL